jgi:hypothetical protein
VNATSTLSTSGLTRPFRCLCEIFRLQQNRVAARHAHAASFAGASDAAGGEGRPRDPEPRRRPHRADYAVIALWALSMGIQAVGARNMNSFGVSTVVFATPLIQIVTSAIGTLARRAGAGASPASNVHVGTLAAYGFGAVLAAFAVSHDVGALIWLPVAAVLSALVLLLLADMRDRTSA